MKSARLASAVTVTSPAPARPASSRPAVAVPAAAIAMLAATTIAVSGCGGQSKPSHDAVKAKVKSEALFAKASDAQVDCFTDVIIKYGSAGDLNAFVQGTKTLDAVQGRKADEAAERADAQLCAKR